MEYKMLVSTSVDNLTKEVNDYLKTGWELYEHPFAVTPIASPIKYGQSLVKRRTRPDTDPK
jgi:hypothetical protein